MTNRANTAKILKNGLLPIKGGQEVSGFSHITEAGLKKNDRLGRQKQSQGKIHLTSYFDHASEFYYVIGGETKGAYKDRDILVVNLDDSYILEDDPHDKKAVTISKKFLLIE